MSASDAHPRVLVLGGTGFVGAAVTKALRAKGAHVTTLSRRGGDGQGDVKGDATKAEAVRAVLEDGPKYDAVVHAVGMLLASDLNAIASGSGSTPDPDATYDGITRVTALNALTLAQELCTREDDGRVNFAFVSAAEAGWPADAPFVPRWLQDYLVAKRAVEAALASSSATVRSTVVRPSLVYTPDRPLSLPAVAAFTALNAVGAPGVDRPVTVDDVACTIADRVLYGAGEPSEVMRYEAVEERAARWRGR